MLDFLDYNFDIIEDSLFPCYDKLIIEISNDLKNINSYDHSIFYTTFMEENPEYFYSEYEVALYKRVLCDQKFFLVSIKRDKQNNKNKINVSELFY